MQSKGHPKTKYFDSCRAVFQGGGCRGVALAGAYQAAHDSGVFFAEVAGTSAGSIMAAFVGAGASPDFVGKELRQLDFLSLLTKPTDQDGFKTVGRRMLGWLIKTLSDDLAAIVLTGGVHSSQEIEQWMDDRLAVLLPDAPRPIKFKDLLRPTYIVASDLASGSARVWSSEVTPDESVAFAVRASCSIPLYFQPTVQGNGRFVDGGVLSNLPTFVFNNKTGGRILGFCLTEEFESPSSWDPKNLLMRTIDTMIGGAIKLQTSLQQNVYSIEIPTLGIGATDFHLMEEEMIDRLFDSGFNKTRDFISSESQLIRGNSTGSQFLVDEDQLNAKLVEFSEIGASRIIVSDTNTEWFWSLFPTVIHWLSQGARVQVITRAASGSGRKLLRELTRRKNLQGLRVEIIERETIPMRAFLFIREASNASSAIVGWRNPNSHSPLATVYEGSADQQIIDTIYQSFNELIPTSGDQDYRYEIVSKDENELLEMIRVGVSQYLSKSVTLSIEEVEVSKIEPITKLVRAYKYRQIVRLVEAYERAGLALFEPAEIVLNNGETSVVAPPVIEERGGKLIGIEGNTRTIYCWRNGIERIKCVVVRNVTDPLPGTGVSLNQVRIVQAHLSPKQRMPGFDYNQFRRIEGAVHPLVKDNDVR